MGVRTDDGKRGVVCKKIRIYGVVQGVGFRPAVVRHARAAGVGGTVSNTGSCVEIFAEGTEASVTRFLKLVRTEPPKRSVILKIDVKDAPPLHFSSFSIVESAHRDGIVFVSPDIAVCDDCKRELFDPSNRRYLHPFINCTQCGPRLTILEHMPYDRERTSMKAFPMCPDCENEYHNPSSRRYDAQPVCCNSCGPEVYLLEKGGAHSPAFSVTLHGHDAISRARKILKDGGIVAVKGIGGFHLAADGTNEDAVRRLRALKKRPMKPFAVMMKDVETVLRECVVSPEERRILTGHKKPILLLQKRRGRSSEVLLAPSVAPDIPTVGVMLPYAPVQLLLFQYDDGIVMPDILVMTSGNDSGAPIAKDDEAALRELSPMCDAILSNNRDILTRADDSVMDFYRGEPCIIRRSRGYAPLPFLLSEGFRGQVLAVGGELKNTFCLAKDSAFYPSAYVGDLMDARTVRALAESEKRMEELLEISPQIIAADLHPRYHSRTFAEQIAKERGIPIIYVQHHYAHVLSCIAENDYAGSVIGISMDGTGYGTDGTIWGGEFLLADPVGFTRRASIMPFPQAGGDAAAREGWRISVSMIYALEKRRHTEGGILPNSRQISHEICPEKQYEQDENAKEETLRICAHLHLADPDAVKAVMAMADHGINTMPSTSCGRLFDAVASIAGIRRVSTFEGEAATALMYRAMEQLHSSARTLESDCTDAPGRNANGSLQSTALSCFSLSSDAHATETADTLQSAALSCSSLSSDAHAAETADSALANGTPRIPFSLTVPAVRDGRYLLRTDRLLEWLLTLDSATIPLAFHTALAEMIADTALLISHDTGVRVCALTGGVFQNKLLLSLTEDALKKRGLAVLRHHLIPPNDGGIALGQALYAMNFLKAHANT